MTFKKGMRNNSCFLLLSVAMAVPVGAADDTAARIGRAASVFSSMADSGHNLTEQIASADCVAIFPGFKKKAGIIGVGYGQGFLSCRNGNSWSAPAAIVLESGSLGAQIGGEAVDIVVLSLDWHLRSKLTSERFTVGTDASAAWVDGKTALDDQSHKVLFFGHTSGVFAGFGLDGATLKPDESGNRRLYGRTLSNSAIVAGEAPILPAASSMIAALTRATNR
jgi:lipid-binding SYLF domain-containing protein